MLQLFAFDRVGIAIGDIYFVDPEPTPGQEGAEHGVRLEVRLMEELPRDGSIYAARPILIGEPLWRCDLLESVEGTAGSFDRTHHHPEMTDWEPGDRTFERGLSGQPLGWLGDRLGGLRPTLEAAGLAPEVVESDEAQIRSSAPEIVAVVERMLQRVREGDLAVPSEEQLDAELVRTGWL
jgi:hypothetical protein